MKTKTLSFFTTIAAITFAISAQAESINPTFESVAREIPAPIQNVFIPQGFDSNDNSEVIISGTFPNSCYKMGKTSHKYNEVEQKIFVEVTAYHIKSEYCLTINIPFLQVVQLGTLDAGKYPVVVNNLINTSIPIAQAPADQERRDDFLYASVYGLIQKGPRTFEIQGVSPNSCYEISEVKVLIESNNVVTVLPIMQKIEGCDELENGKAVAWIKSFDISADYKGKVLVHVRTLNGGSINQVVDLL